MWKGRRSSWSELDQEAIDNFREYLRIPSVHPDINYDKCIEFLKSQAKSLDLPYKLYVPFPNKPILIITWVGTDPKLKSIWLGSHMDVVPVFEEEWKYKPFDAHMDDNGDIYARGTQDMKSVGIQYLEAIRRLKKQNLTFKRTIHVAFVPEEEVRSIMGMKEFAESQDFKDLNVGFALDEGGPSASDEIFLFYGEKSDWKIRVRCPGEQGHGSLLMPNPPGNKIEKVITRFNEFRAQQLSAFLKDPTIITLGNLTSINLTILEGGVQANVVPPEFSATYDMRVAGSEDFDEFEKRLRKWCQEAGEDVTMEFISQEPKIPYSKVDDSNPFWVAFKKAVTELKINVTESISAGNTDARFIRKQGIQAFGFSPINNTTPRAHDANEYLNVEVFLKGIEIYMKIIPNIADAN